MANYKTHTLFNLSLFLPATTLLLFYLLHPSRSDLIGYCASFAYGTLYMCPDADVADKIKLLSIRGIMTLPFRPYSRLFAHRGISHWLVIGTATRVIWLASLFIVPYMIYQRSFSFYPLISFYKAYKSTIIYALSGLCLSDFGHLLLDIPIRRKS